MKPFIKILVTTILVFAIAHFCSGYIFTQRNYIVSYSASVIWIALFAPYTLKWNPQKDIVDLIYYTFASIFAVAVFLTTDFDKRATADNREIMILSDDNRVLKIEIEDSIYISSNKGIITNNILPKLRNNHAVVVYYRDATCSSIPPAPLIPRSGPDKNVVEELERQQLEERCRELTEVVKLFDIISKEKLTPIEEAKSLWRASELASLPSEKVRVRDEGLEFDYSELLDQLEFDAAESAAHTGLLRSKVQQNTAKIETIQKIQRERPIEPSSFIITSAFVSDWWPFLLLALLGLKISRYPYLRALADRLSPAEKIPPNPAASSDPRPASGP